MKLLIRFFLSLSFFLLAGNSTIHAHPQGDGAPFASLKAFASSHIAGSGILLNTPAYITQHKPTAAEKNREKIFAEETNEKSHELASAKKQNENAVDNYFTTFYDYTSRYFSYYIRKCLPYRDHFSYWSSDRYIALRVIRI